MKKFLAILKKDALLIVRDWPGLAILFIMPAVLLVIITLTQESAIPSKKSGMKIAIVDNDSSDLGRALIDDLSGSGYFNFITAPSEKEAGREIAAGRCQMAFIIPDSSTEKLYKLLESSPEGSPREMITSRDTLSGVLFLYDPAVQKIFREAVIMPVKALIQLTAVKVLMTKFAENVSNRVKQHSAEFSAGVSGKDYFSGIPEFPYKKEIARRFREEISRKTGEEMEIQLPFAPSFSQEIVTVKEIAAGEKGLELRPGILQNNIPAFTLFAMFFIVIPLAGSIISEKNHGTFDRLRILPVSYLKVVTAKVTLFFGVCILQFIFLMFIGKYIMPLLGEQSSIDLNVSLPALITALTGSSLAAIGFGMMVGAFARTHGQAATFGSVMVVILALLGGIFVPVHMLPVIMRKISMVSPLRWGTDAFLGVFAKYQGITAILPEVSLLIGFFIISILLTIRIFRKR